MRKWAIIIILFILCASLLLACSNRENDKPLLDNFKETLTNANTQYEEISHVEIMKDGVLVFYIKEREDALSLAFIRKTPEKWEKVEGGGYSPLKPKKPLDFHGTNLKEVPLFITYGVIADKNIYKLKVEQNNEQKNAKIITTKDGVRFWFASWDEPTHPPAKYTAFAANGETLYKVE